MITDEIKIKFNETISAIDGMIVRIHKGVVQGNEAVDFFTKQMNGAQALFENTSDEWRTIDRWKNENGYTYSLQYRSSTYAGEQEIEKLTKLTAILGKVLSDNGVVSPAQKEFFFAVGDTYQAKRFICNLFRSAGSKLLIVDEYLDDQFFEYLDIVPETIQVQLITGDQKAIFWTLLTELKKKRANLDARVNGSSHCRYIVIDESAIYSTDASLNTIGKKDFMVHKLEDENEIIKVKSEIADYWSTGKIK